MKYIFAFTLSLSISAFTNCYGQVLNFDFIRKGSIYKGVVESKYFDSLILKPVNNAGNSLLNASGVIYISEHGNFDFSISENMIDSSGDLLFRVGFGWFPMTNLYQVGDSLRFSWDWDFRPSPNAVDLKILKRAYEIFKDEKFWNKVDDRQCNDDNQNKKWSLYCALYKASFDVIGDFNHRNSALEVVRTTIEELTPDKKYEHRLMDFNNQSSFKEIQELLSTSIEKFEKILTQD